MNLRPVSLSDHPLVRELLDHYYRECPGTLFPLLLLYLANTGNLDAGERAREVSYTDDSFRFTGHTLIQFSREDALQTGSDPAGRRLLERWESNGQTQISVVMPEIPEDGDVRRARELIHRHDDPLIQTASQKKALVMLAQGLLRLDEDVLRAKYSYFFRSALQLSGRYGDIHRMDNLMTIASGVFGECGGRAFFPYTRLPWMAPHLKGVDVTAEFSKPGEQDLDLAISALLFNVPDAVRPRLVKAENSFGALEEGVRYGLVFSDREDRWAMDPVLTHLRDRLTPDATVAFLLDEKEFFNVACRQTCFLRDFVKRGKLDRVILLPSDYHRVLVVIRNGKQDGPIILTNLYETRVPPLRNTLTHLFKRKDLNREITVEDLAGEKYHLGNFFRYRVPAKPGFCAMPLRRLLSSIPLSPSSFGSVTDDYEGYNAVCYPSSWRYKPSAARLEVQDAPFSFFPEPVYLIDSESLVVRKKGPLEPCVIEPFYGSPAIFDDGIAFHVNDNASADYIINELRRPYVLSQLRDWDHSREGIHSTDEIMNLVILVPVDEDGDPDRDRQESIARKELDDAYLPVGEEVDAYETSVTYRIVKPLGRGCFGLSYEALRLPGIDEEEPVRVVLKEFFINLYEEQDTERDEDTLSARHNIGDIDSIVSDRDESAERRRFIREAKFMQRFGRIPDSHIRPATSVFTCKALNNVFYETVFYDYGDLTKLLEEHGVFEEEEAVVRFIIPVAKALHVMHGNRYVHHDVKPENIFIDDDGLAVLGDFGVAKQYGANGVQLSSGERSTGSPFAAPEEFSEAHESFHPEMDVYSLGAVLLNLLTGFNPRKFDGEMADHILNCPDFRVSEATVKAIAGALQEDPSERFQTVMDFVHALPGHETDEFVLREPERPAAPEEGTDDGGR